MSLVKTVLEAIPPIPQTCICLALLVVVSQRLVVQGQIDLDGGSSSFIVKGMLP